MRNIYITVATLQPEAWRWLKTGDGTGITDQRRSHDLNWICIGQGDLKVLEAG